MKEVYDNYVAGTLQDSKDRVAEQEAFLLTLGEGDARITGVEELISSYTAQTGHFEERAEQYRLDWDRAIQRSHRAEFRDAIDEQISEA